LEGYWKGKSINKNRVNFRREGENETGQVDKGKEPLEADLVVYQSSGEETLLRRIFSC